MLETAFMKFTSTKVLPEVIIIEPDVFNDRRGYFIETYQAQKYSEHGIPTTFVQDNQSFSVKGVIRGLHYQLSRPQGKLVWVTEGEIMDVVVDIRRGSPMFGKWIDIMLSSNNFRQIYIPEGFAHGYCIISDNATFIYKCTDYYDPGEERGILWNDPSLNIDWPITDPFLSDRDKQFAPLAEISEDDLPIYKH